MSNIVERLRKLDLLRAGDNPPSWTDLGSLGNEAADEIEFLRATIADDAAVIGRLNSGEELQALMKINNDLRAKIVQLRLVAGAVSVESQSYDDIRNGIKVTFCTEVDSVLAKELK